MPRKAATAKPPHRRRRVFRIVIGFFVLFFGCIAVALLTPNNRPTVPLANATIVSTPLPAAKVASAGVFSSTIAADATSASAQNTLAAPETPTLTEPPPANAVLAATTSQAAAIVAITPAIATDIKATAISAVKLRAGPGIDYDVVGGLNGGDRVEITGSTADGQWYQLATGAWVAAFLISTAAPPASLPPIASATATEADVAASRAVAPVVVAAELATPLPTATLEPPTATLEPPTAVAPAANAGGGEWTNYTCENNPSPAPDPKCAIKGNISRSGEKIYHSPGQQDYCKTEIITADGERWFCSGIEAEAAGWRAAKR